MLNQETLTAIMYALGIAYEYEAARTGDQETIAKLCKAEGAISELIGGDAIAVIWHIDDVKSLQDDEDEFTEDQRITDAQAREILKAADVNHDAEQGINWDVLRYHAENILPQGAIA